MKRVLIWEAQSKAFGRVSSKTTRRLKQIARGKTAPTIAKPGSVLVREWNGRTYQVEVVAGGYVLDGKTWRFLSAIARHITGAHWSPTPRIAVCSDPTIASVGSFGSLPGLLFFALGRSRGPYRTVEHSAAYGWLEPMPTAAVIKAFAL